MAMVKIMAGEYFTLADISPYTDGTYKITFPYNKALIEEIKNLEAARWNPEGKYWTFKKSERNMFALKYLLGKNPYEKWKKPSQIFKPNRDSLMAHQKAILNEELTRRQLVIAADPGCGKTLAAIEAMELSGEKDWLWVGPNSALRAVELEFIKWNSKIYPRISTYDSIKKIIKTWPMGRPAYKGVVFDEAHLLRNMGTQRYEAAKYIVDAMFKEHDDPYIFELSGTPSPHDPSNWFSLIELIRPGFIREPNLNKFKKKLALIKDRESLSGGWFPELITYWDDEKKCKICGQYENDLTHNPESEILGYNVHDYEKSVNEVEGLYKKLKGIVHITRKKDVLKELPDKIYKIIRCEPSEDVLRAAKLILASAKNVVSANVLLRELSDGFQYKEKEIGEKECDLCHGRKTIDHPVPSFTLDECINCGGTIQDFKCISCDTDYTPEYSDQTIDCPRCSGTGTIPKFEREAIQIPCEKEAILRELLEEYEEIGRVVIYAGFQGSVDRCVSIARDMKWDTIRVDGRGWETSLGEMKQVKMLQYFQDKYTHIKKLAFIAQPDSGGMGLTLTESPVEIFYSNSFIPSSRQQSEERIHRPGMYINRGATIIDIFNLPTDEKVFNILKNSQRLQDMTLGMFAEVLK